MKLCFDCPSASLWAVFLTTGQDCPGLRWGCEWHGNGGMEWSWSVMNGAAGEALLDVALKHNIKAMRGAFVIPA